MNTNEEKYYSKACPRCDGFLECFQSHSYCASCNYSDVLDEPYRMSAEMECHLLEQHLLKQAELFKQERSDEEEEILPEAV